MWPEYAPQLITGLFVLTAASFGALLGGLLSRGAERRRIRAEDDRRWLADRRTVYGKYLGLCKALLEQIDRIGVFLPYNPGDALSDEDDKIIREDLHDYWTRWEDVLQPALAELQLLASPKVADLSDRASAALMDITGPIETRKAFTEYYPTWFQTQDLIQVMVNSMRRELGLSDLPIEGRGRDNDQWPWLTSRPPRESYATNGSATKPSPEPHP